MIYKTMIYCSHCKSMDKPLLRFSKSISARQEVQYCNCRECNAIRMKRYYKANPKRFYKMVRRSEARQPEKQRARLLLNWHVQKGNVHKPDRCEDCGEKKKRICGHHHDYTKPLDVEWLCTGCHANRHRAEKHV